MNCSTCRYELSQCLDGRLPSGRRAIVMQHVEACAVCSTFWNDLQAAQNLTLRLGKMPVSDGFRERLWERIGAGEGTPAAVFHEPVPLLTKFRYAVTGAAAAAVILLGVTWARSDRDSAPRDPVARPDRHPGSETVGDPSTFWSAHPLTCELVAVETAKQLEQRHATVTAGIRKLNQDGFAQDAARSDAAVQQILRNADEFCAFGEVLLDLRDHKRLFFTDSEVDADLRNAVKLLRNSEQQESNLETVRSLVAPALSSGRLANMSRTIMVPSDPREEGDVLMRLIVTRHDVFPKLFIVFGNNDEAYRDFGLTGNVFEMRDECGPVWVAPRSEVEAGDGRLRMRSRLSGQMLPGIQILTGRPKQSAAK
jgi:hypothetical protein